MAQAQSDVECGSWKDWQGQGPGCLKAERATHGDTEKGSTWEDWGSMGVPWSSAGVGSAAGLRQAAMKESPS